MADDEHPADIDTDRVRAGSTPGIARYILGISLLLVVVAFAIILLS